MPEIFNWSVYSYPPLQGATVLAAGVKLLLTNVMLGLLPAIPSRLIGLALKKLLFAVPHGQATLAFTVVSELGKQFIVTICLKVM
jgi:hypothetical protein